MKQIELNFDPIEHRYFDEENRTYRSVTQLIQLVEPVFDKRYWSMYTALKDSLIKVRPTEVGKIINVNGVNRTIDSLYSNPINSSKVNKVISEWKEKTDVSIVRGNKIHDHLETSINKSKDDEEGKTNNVIKPLQGSNFIIFDSKHDLDKTDLASTYPEIYVRLLHFINLGCIIYAEKRIYNSKYFIAGTIDVLIVKGKSFAIMDWKTNKDEMMFHSGYYKKVLVNGKWIRGDKFIRTDNRLLYPLEHLQACKGNIYSMQLSIYARMMEYWGYSLVPNGLEIFHIRPQMKPKLIKIQYYKDEATKLISHNLQIENNKISNNNITFGLQ